MGKKNSKGQRGGVRDGLGRKRRRDHYAMRNLATANRALKKKKMNTQMAQKRVSARVTGTDRKKASRARVALSNPNPKLVNNALPFEPDP